MSLIAANVKAPPGLRLARLPRSRTMGVRHLVPRRRIGIAPNLPGLGFTEVTRERRYKYTFDASAGTVQAFTDAVSLERYALLKPVTRACARTTAASLLAFCWHV